MLQLCRDVYHCLPSELAAEDAGVIRTHLALLSAEARVRGMGTGARGAGLGMMAKLRGWAGKRTGGGQGAVEKPR